MGKSLLATAVLMAAALNPGVPTPSIVRPWPQRDRFARSEKESQRRLAAAEAKRARRAAKLSGGRQS